MALTDTNEPGPAKVPLPGDTISSDSDAGDRNVRALPPAALQALGRLTQLHAETSEAASLSRFLHAAVGAGAVLTLMGCLAVTFASGATLQLEFAWSLLVLAGVGAMLRTYIKSVAQSLDRPPLRESAKDLRAVMFYVGFAWGAGAFLLLGNNPIPFTGLCFALLPSILMVPLLKDRRASLAFIAPVTMLTAAAILLQPWSDAAAALVMLLIVQGSIIAGLTLTGKPRSDLPAGLSLR
jgi:hypothetical protein